MVFISFTRWISNQMRFADTVTWSICFLWILRISFYQNGLTHYFQTHVRTNNQKFFLHFTIIWCLFLRFFFFTLWFLFKFWFCFTEVSQLLATSSLISLFKYLVFFFFSIISSYFHPLLKCFFFLLFYSQFPNCCVSWPIYPLTISLPILFFVLLAFFLSFFFYFEFTQKTVSMGIFNFS